MNLWEKTLFFVNGNYRAGLGFVKRKDMLKFVYGENLRKQKIYTIDSYRRMLELGGFVEKVKPGVYKIVKYVPLGLGKRELRKKVYPDTYYYEKYGVKPILGFNV